MIVLKKHWHILLIIISMLNTASFLAQNNEEPTKVLKQLTKEQKEMLVEQQRFIDRSKKEFKKSLTDEQKKILLNRTI